MASVKRKHVKSDETNIKFTEEPLFVNAPPDESDDNDTTDSEESEFSGLEEEPDTSDEETSSDGENSNVDSEESNEEVSDSDVSDEASTSKDVKSREKENNMKNNKKTVKNEKAKQISDNSTNQVVFPLSHNEYYDYDSSDEEDPRNTVGNIPMEWYKEYEHIGYDLSGKKIIKPPTGDELDEFLNKMDNPDYWRTVKDKSTGQNVRLSDKDVDIVERFKKGKFIDASYNPYEPWVDMFSHEVMQTPLTAHPPQKRSFIPSKWEKMRVSRMVHSIKMGWMKIGKPKSTEDEDATRFYELWKKEDESEISKRFAHHIPAPKMALPGHAESYNPPPEFLFTEEEELQWKEQERDERRQNFIPAKFSSLRLVPGYSRFINERFERCLDLYLCPRQRKMRMNVNPEDLIPKLPKPKDLQPFPTVQSIIYKGHSSLVRCISPSPCGQWLVSGSDDHSLKLWEVATGRCMNTLKFGGVVKDVTWTPNVGLCLVAAAVDDVIYIVNPKLGDKMISENTDNMINSYSAESGGKKDNIPVTWTAYDGSEQEQGLRLKIQHPKSIQHISWHAKGDYLAVVMPEAEAMSVLIHQISKRRSQNPFRKPKGLVQRVLFHPTRPYLFVATQRYVRVYNLMKQELTKKLMTNCKWVSSMAVHSGGDNIIIGSYDCKLSWFDLDLSSKPYQTLRHHKKAVRSVAFHPHYPLFASASDDGSVIVCHGKVYNDLLQNPLIVPVKVLRGHEATKNLGVLDCTFHPTQPWLFSSGSDHTIRLFT